MSFWELPIPPTLSNLLGVFGLKKLMCRSPLIRAGKEKMFPCFFGHLIPE